MIDSVDVGFGLGLRQIPTNTKDLNFGLQHTSMLKLDNSSV